MTVSELIAELQNHDPDLEVQFVYNYGDHWKTNVAAEVKYVEAGNVRHSEYHRMDAVVEEDHESEEGDKQVVLLW